MSAANEKELVRFIFRYMLIKYFGTKTNMAQGLGISLRTIQKLFAQLESDSSKGGSVVLEKILLHCVKNKISVDEMLLAFIEQQDISIKDKEYVNFPCPEGLRDDMKEIYRNANGFVQSVAGCLCPKCKVDCHPEKGDKWLWNDCLVSHMAMRLLSQIMTIQEK